MPEAFRKLLTTEEKQDKTFWNPKDFFTKSDDEQIKWLQLDGQKNLWQDIDLGASVDD